MSAHLVLLILHVLGAGLLIGVSVMAFVAIAKPPLTRTSLDRMFFVGRFGMWASIAQFVTGGLLVSLEWDELASNPWVWTKIGLWVLEGTLSSMVIGRQVKTITQALDRGEQPPGRNLATTARVVMIVILLISAIGVMVVES